MNYAWNWHIFWELSLEGRPHYVLLLNGLAWTVSTALCAWVLALVLGSVVGVLRTLPWRGARALGTCWVELFRNVPLLMQVFIWFFVRPALLPARAGDTLKHLDHGPFLAAVCAIGFFMSARVAEQVRAGVQALPRGQRMAGTALGLTLPQTYRYVLLPMTFRIILPPLTSEFLNIIKNSSVALTIGVVELTAAARAMQEYSFQVFEAFTAATVIYIVVNIVVVFAMRWVERRVAVPGFIGPAVQAGGH